MAFRDHHPFTRRDIARIAAAAKTTAAAIVLTTEKDAVRFAACDLGDLPLAAVPLHVGLEPEEGFRDWLMTQLSAARIRHPGTLAPGTSPPGTLASWHPGT
jgi:tetraacyldisaccharide-1-P 4'-kinase